MKNRVVKIILALTCVSVLAVGCGENTAPKKVATKVEQQVKKDTEKAKPTEEKRDIYYAIQDGVTLHNLADSTSPVVKTLKVNDEIKILGKEEEKGFRKVEVAVDEAMAFVDKDMISKEKIKVSADATAPTQGTTTPAQGTTTPAQGSTTTPKTGSTGSTTTTKPSTPTTTPTKPSTPAPAQVPAPKPVPTPAPVPAPTPAPAPAYTPIPAGWNTHNSVCGSMLNATQKAYIDSLVNSWKSGSITDDSLKRQLMDYLSNQRVQISNIMIGKQRFITTALRNTTSSVCYGVYDMGAEYSTGTKDPSSNNTVCYQYEVSIY